MYLIDIINTAIDINEQFCRITLNSWNESISLNLHIMNRKHTKKNERVLPISNTNEYEIQSFWGLGNILFRSLFEEKSFLYFEQKSTLRAWVKKALTTLRSLFFSQKGFVFNILDFVISLYRTLIYQKGKLSNQYSILRYIKR